MRSLESDKLAEIVYWTRMAWFFYSRIKVSSKVRRGWSDVGASGWTRTGMRTTILARRWREIILRHVDCRDICVSDYNSPSDTVQYLDR